MDPETRLVLPVAMLHPLTVPTKIRTEWRIDPRVNGTAARVVFRDELTVPFG